MTLSIKEQQQSICLKYGTSYVDVIPDLKVGISKNVKTGLMPINGLRHPLEGDTSGWYIWAGEEGIPQGNDNFFMPLHISHLQDWCPMALKFLGLPPGWRFLTDGKHEDVWEDKSLLNV